MWKPGLEPQAWASEPTWSACQGWALARLEQAQLSGLRASSKLQAQPSTSLLRLELS